MSEEAKKSKKGFKYFVSMILLLIMMLIAIPALFIATQIPFSKLSLLKEGYVQVEYDQESKKPIYLFTQDKPKSWLNLKNISAHAQESIVISEDWAFFTHQGVDLNQLRQAMDEHLNEGKKLRGASTLSQQVVKNLFLDHERSFVRKGRELLITVAMEKQLSKEKILEIYLNVVEFGEGLYGIEDASRFYFKKAAKDLNAKEAAFLAMLLPNPKRYSVSFREKALTDYASQTIGSIMEKRRSVGQLSDEQMKRELARRLNFEARPKTRVSAKTAVKPATTLKRPSSFDDGSSFEKRYKRDQDLVFNSAAAFDPRSLDSIDLDVDVEFSLE